MGCAWLLDRWGELQDVLDGGLKWQAPDRFKAIRLLGKQPTDPVLDPQVRRLYMAGWAMEPEAKHPFDDVSNEFHHGERVMFVERLDGRKARDEALESPEAGRTALVALVAEQVNHLEDLLARHLDRDAAASVDRLEFDDSHAGELVRRYQMACNRTLVRVLQTYFKLRNEVERRAKPRRRGIRRSMRPCAPRTGIRRSRNRSTSRTWWRSRRRRTYPLCLRASIRPKPARRAWMRLRTRSMAAPGGRRAGRIAKSCKTNPTSRGQSRFGEGWNGRNRVHSTVPGGPQGLRRAETRLPTARTRSSPRARDRSEWTTVLPMCAEQPGLRIRGLFWPVRWNVTGPPDPIRSELPVRQQALSEDLTR